MQIAHRTWAVVAVLAGGAAMGASSIAELHVPAVAYDGVFKGNHVQVLQRGNVVEATLPWKDQPGLMVRYDMGEVTAKERLLDRRGKQIIVENPHRNTALGAAEGEQQEGVKIDILLNEKPATTTFCYQITGWESYDFFYQPPLSEEEVAQGAYRPEEIVGSYAVYHKTLHDFEEGETNYETGKVMHIPYPYIWSVNATSTTKHRAQDFSIKDGSMCVTVAQSDLDTMEYPIRIDPTFGYTSVGGTNTSLLANETAGNYYISPPDSGATSLSKISLYAQYRLSSDQYKGVLYDSSGNVVTNGTGSATNPPVAYGWTDSTFGTPPTITTNTSYGINVVMSSTTDYKYDTVTSAYGLYDSTNSFASPQSITISDSGNIKMSVYATWDQAVCDPTTTWCTDIFTKTGSSTWIAPANVTSAKAACWGPGGGGGVVSGSGGAGGGGGAFASSTVSVTPGNGYTIYVGAGGVPNNNASTTSSTFGTTTVVAKGGKGATTAAGYGGFASTSVGDVRYSGGKGGEEEGTVDAGGGGGGAGGPAGAGVDGKHTVTLNGGNGGDGNAGSGGSGGIGGDSSVGGVGGNGGASVLGGGGGGGSANGSSGGNAGMYGGGGGGGEISGGGQGANGRCEVTYTSQGAAAAGGYGTTVISGGSVLVGDGTVIFE